VTVESRESPRLRQSDFHSSPQLTHQRANSATSFRRASFHPVRSASVSEFRSTPNSPSLEQGALRGDVFAFARRSIDGGWRPFGGRRKSESRGSAPPPAPSSAMSSPLIPRNMSTTSLDTAASGDSWGRERGGGGAAGAAAVFGAGEKKQSRTSRLLKRMSSSISSIAHGSRVQLQTLSERAAHEEEAERSLAQRPKAVAVGDLNVQFPDTLVCSSRCCVGVVLTSGQLWKRRWVEIDDYGYLILKPNGGAERTNNGIVKRFHLNEFLAPFTPDLDRQELPYSACSFPSSTFSLTARHRPRFQRRTHAAVRVSVTRRAARRAAHAPRLPPGLAVVAASLTMRWVWG
jgi:hypothetical protein